VVVALLGAAGLALGAAMSSPVLVGLGAALVAVGVTAAVSAHAPARLAPASRAAPVDQAPSDADMLQEQPQADQPSPVDEPRSAGEHPDSAPRPARDPVPAGERIPASLEPHVVLSSLAESVRHIAEPVGVSLWLADDSTATLRQISAIGAMAPSAQPVPTDDSAVMARAHATGAVQFEEYARVRTGGPAESLWRLAIPVVAADHRGVAAVDFRSVTPLDTSLLPEATAPLRASLAGALALHVAATELETARALVEVARDLSRVLDPDEVLSLALGRAMELTGAATGSVMLLEPESGRLVISLARGLPDDVVKTTTLGDGEGIAGWVLTSGQPLLIEDLPARSPAARRHGIRSAVSVPIADDDGTLGVLNVGSRSFPARFSESHLRAIEMLGRQTATALRNARAVSESRELYFDTLKALALALETKDPYSRGGTERVLEYADAIGSVFELTDEEREALRIAALLHDIGMASVGEAVVTSDRTLTTVERALLKMHPQIAAEILSEAPALRHVVPIVYHHHEWYDGEGYVGGLAGQAIPIGARILAVADAYVAMTSDRPYRRAFSTRDALRELADKAGTQFDPAVVDALRDILRDGSNQHAGTGF
jgi:response regulator RpfG family c-di-GMP phosphodiesterase/PAS domain-containing protein